MILAFTAISPSNKLALLFLDFLLLGIIYSLPTIENGDPTLPLASHIHI